MVLSSPPKLLDPDAASQHLCLILALQQHIHPPGIPTLFFLSRFPDMLSEAIAIPAAAHPIGNFASDICICTGPTCCNYSLKAPLGLLETDNQEFI
jgi:hypothetical protein